MINQHAPDLASMQEALRSLRDLPPRQVLTRLVTMMGASATNPQILPFLRVFIQEAMRNPVVAAAYEQRFVRPMADALEEYFAYQIQRGAVRPGDPQIYTMLLVSPMLGANLAKNLLQLKRLESLDLQTLFSQVLSLVLDGILLQEGESTGA